MGLLDKAQTLDTGVQTDKSDDPTILAASIISKFPHSRENIDYPGELYRSFRNLLGFSKGSLLFPDEAHQEYFPWIITGLDRTSSRRIRIPFDLPPLINNSGTLIQGVPLENLAPMLSNREFGLLGSPILIRLGTEGHPAALILAMDCSRNTESDLRLAEAIEMLNEHLGDGIAHSRHLIEFSEDDEKRELSQWLSTWGETKAILVILDTTNAIDALVETLPGLELFRARRDVVSLIRHITGRMGRLYDLQDGRVLILFPAERMSDHDLYLHQLTRSFTAAFHKLSFIPEFPAIFHAWPEDREMIEKSLAGYI
jgi:hypothetical protein